MTNGILDSGQKIITDGLVLNLDAAQLRSYPTTGTTWSDLSGNNNNGTLVNGPTFNSGNGGSIVFDGVNDYLVCSSNNSVDVNSFTWSATVQGLYNGVGCLLYIGNPVGSGATPYKVFIGVVSSKLYINYNGVLFSFGNLVNNTIYYLTITYNQNITNMYVNDVFVGSSTARTGTLTSRTNLFLASTIGSSEFFNGRIFNTLLYNRALTAQEIQQNYNANKSRYGL